MLESIVGNVSGLAEKYASHLIAQCPAEVKQEMLKFEKERTKPEEQERLERHLETVWKHMSPTKSNASR